MQDYWTATKKLLLLLSIRFGNSAHLKIILPPTWLCRITIFIIIAINFIIQLIVNSSITFTKNASEINQMHNRNALGNVRDIMLKIKNFMKQYICIKNSIYRTMYGLLNMSYMQILGYYHLYSYWKNLSCSIIIYMNCLWDIWYFRNIIRKLKIK